MRSLDGRDFPGRVFPGQHDQIGAQLFRESDTGCAGDRHLGGAMDRKVGRKRADETADADVLHERRVHSGGDDRLEIFLGGGVGYVAWHGTQHNPSVKRKDNGIPQAPAGTLAVIGDLKQMKPEWLVGTSMLGYGTTLSIGIGVPIPILDEETLKYAAIKERERSDKIIFFIKPQILKN